MRLAALLLGMTALVTAPAALAQQRAVVEASAPSDLSVTIYRDPDRAPDAEMRRDFPRGFAMISETRTVTLPAGESRIRFEGVAEGMVGVSAIVTGLPGGTIEKNRNAELLSPAALVNGALGNRVTITRTNPATGRSVSQEAVVRTRADGGLVLQTDQGFEAVRCAGLPEKLTFDRVPDGLSAEPIYSVDTRTDAGGTFEVTLTYLAWGFDWQANYVATLGQRADDGGDENEFSMQLLSWLTLLNDNGQSFDNANLQIIAGKLNVESNFERLSDPPVASPLRLTCYPIGSTKAGTPVSSLLPPPPPPPPPPPMMAPQAIMVTGSRMSREVMDSAAPVVTAEEENLGDLKLFRVPDRVNVSAKGQKQVAFLNQNEVKARYLYTAGCNVRGVGAPGDNMQPAGILLVTKNDEDKGLGIALPQGALTIYEPTSKGIKLSAATDLRDLARGQDVELELGQSSQVHAHCSTLEKDPEKWGGPKWQNMSAVLSNANPHPVKLRLQLGWSGGWDVRFPGEKVVVKNGYKTVELTIPANSREEFRWKIRSSERD